MQVPKKKISKSRRDMRRSHHAISANLLVGCTSCGEKKLRHTVCPHCGQYRKKQVVQISS